MPRLLHVTTVAKMLQGFLLPYARHFREQGWRVDALAQDASSCPQCRASFDHVWDVAWSRNPLDAKNFIGAPRAIRDIVVREQYDLVHVHTPVAAFITRWALRKLRRRGKPKVIYTAHGFRFYRGGPRLNNLVFRNLEKRAARWTDYLVVMNSDDHEDAQRYGIIDSRRLLYMPGIGIDRNQYSAKTVTCEDIESIRGELGLGPEDRYFLVIAELIPRKRVHDVLRALARLNRTDVHLVVAGDGPLRSRLLDEAQRLDIATKVRFLGYRQDIPVLLQGSVAIMLSSTSEGLPRSIMEAMCQGVPVIGSDIRGVEDLLQSGCGLLAPVGEPDAFARHMAWVLDHPEGAKAMAEKGRAQMDKYDIAHLIDLHEDLYARALNAQIEK